MAKDCSFDVVSEFDKQELVNAVDQAQREISSRFDLKNSNSEIPHENPCIPFEIKYNPNATGTFNAITSLPVVFCNVFTNST